MTASGLKRLPRSDRWKRMLQQAEMAALQLPLSSDWQDQKQRAKRRQKR